MLLAACRSSDPVRDFYAREVTLPDGKAISVEVMATQIEMSRGLMFADKLAPNHGMLFVHGTPGRYPYWMYQVKFPIDIVWMDSNHRVVEIAANTPPCPSASAKECPNFGGREIAQFVIELNAGDAARHGVQIGSFLSF